MKNSKQARHEAKQIYRCCLVDGLLDEQKAGQAAQLLGSRKPRGYREILVQFHRLVKLDQARHSARVESPVSLTDSQISELQASLAAKYGKGLNVTFWTNPTLLGGLRIQVGSDVFDGSIRARLQALRDAF